MCRNPRPKTLWFPQKKLLEISEILKQNTSIIYYIINDKISRKYQSQSQKVDKNIDSTNWKDEVNPEYVITGTSLSPPCSRNVVSSRSSFWLRFQGSKIEGPTYQVPLFLKERIREQVLKRHTSVSLSMERGLPRTRSKLIEKRRIIGKRERRGHEVPLLASLLMLLLEPPYLQKKKKTNRSFFRFWTLYCIGTNWRTFKGTRIVCVIWLHVLVLGMR